MHKFIVALKHAWVIFLSYYKGSLSDEMTADLYEQHLKYRKRNPAFQQNMEYSQKAIVLAAGESMNDWLNDKIPTIVPNEEIWKIIEEVKMARRG